VLVWFCLERGADLHMAQLMPLPLTVSCFSKIEIGFTFLVPAHLGSPGKGPLNGYVVIVLNQYATPPTVVFTKKIQTVKTIALITKQKRSGSYIAYGVLVDGDLQSVAGQCRVPATVDQVLRHVHVHHLVIVLVYELGNHWRRERRLSRVRPQIYPTL